MQVTIQDGSAWLSSAAPIDSWWCIQVSTVYISIKDESLTFGPLIRMYVHKARDVQSLAIK